MSPPLVCILQLARALAASFRYQRRQDICVPFSGPDSRKLCAPIGSEVAHGAARAVPRLGSTRLVCSSGSRSATNPFVSISPIVAAVRPHPPHVHDIGVSLPWWKTVKWQRQRADLFCFPLPPWSNRRPFARCCLALVCNDGDPRALIRQQQLKRLGTLDLPTLGQNV